MLTEKRKDFIESFSKKSINAYEDGTGKKYIPNDINSVVDYINFFNGKVIYVKFNEQYNMDGACITKEDDSFIILIDEKYLKENKKVDIIKLIFRMFYIYSDNRLRNGIEPNKLIYPQNHFLFHYEIAEGLIEKNNTKVKQLTKKLVDNLNNYISNF